MRTLFASLLLGLGLLSVLVWVTQPPPAPSGKTRIVRCADNNPVREAQVTLYAKTHPEIDLVLDPQGNATEKTIVESLGGEGPDVFDCFDPTQLSAYVRAGIALDISDRLKQDGIDLIRDIFPGMLPSCIYGGKTYGIPTNIAVNAIWVHEDLLKEAGIPIHQGPWTWDDFIPIAQKLTQRGKDGKPIRYGFYFDWWNWEHFFLTFGADIFSEDGRHCTLASPQGIAAAQLMYDLVYKYHVAPTPIEEASGATEGGFGSGSISIFGARQAAMALGGRWWLVQLRTYKGLHLNVMESPNGGARQFSVAGRSLLINKFGHHVDLAYAYALSLTGPDYNHLVNDQSDGISAFKKYAPDSAFAPNPSFPDEHGDLVWKQTTEFGAKMRTSPYVNGSITTRIVNAQLDLVKADQKNPAQAMKDAAAQIDAEIQKSLAEDPVLKARYEGKP